MTLLPKSLSTETDSVKRGDILAAFVLLNYFPLSSPVPSDEGEGGEQSRCPRTEIQTKAAGLGKDL
jgi:hypothetical protein